MGVFAPGCTMHEYDAWLLTTDASILDDHLSISSAGLLTGGAVPWVEVSADGEAPGRYPDPEHFGSFRYWDVRDWTGPRTDSVPQPSD